MKKIFLSLSILLSLCCAVKGQGVPNAGGMGVPNQAPFIGFTTIAKSGAASSHTGDTNEATLATIAIPPNTLGANGQLRVNAYWTTTNSANNKTLRVRVGGISGTVIGGGTATTSASLWSNTVMFNLNATNSNSAFNEIARGTDGLVTTSLVASTSIDMTQSQSLVLTGQLALGTETVTLIGYSVEAIF